MKKWTIYAVLAVVAIIVGISGLLSGVEGAFKLAFGVLLVIGAVTLFGWLKRRKKPDAAG